MIARTSHDGDIRECPVDGLGVHIQAPLCGVRGILTSRLAYAFADERVRRSRMFGERGSAGG